MAVPSVNMCAVFVLGLSPSFFIMDVASVGSLEDFHVILCLVVLLFSPLTSVFFQW